MRWHRFNAIPLNGKLRRCPMKAILVTACPAGIATSFLAAKRIEQQAKLAGWELTDVGSSVQPRQVPGKEQIAAADLVLVVASAPVDLAAYDGKRVYQGSMDLALQDPAALLEAATSGASPIAIKPRPLPPNRPPLASASWR